MLQEAGDWIAVYNPDRDGDLDEWIKRIRSGMSDSYDCCGGYNVDDYGIVEIELPNDIIESVEDLAYLIPENNINGTYAWILREGVKSINNKLDQGLI